eukprot:gnl/TRDRNA2_/TRDRNA2_194861_c0_seq1.p1 gnl/TRDRNA2_/TRDRNA2_194861_c0~~gnl/TRDRNA2_/TRDRNA2_194861_c0_seq1.p1  ORF type:complete len:262 (+),score=27.02 gnl/TRDRNA2_/TRDRNA2_194861_c0_seq1:42-827(+)
MTRCILCLITMLSAVNIVMGSKSCSDPSHCDDNGDDQNTLLQRSSVASRAFDSVESGTEAQIDPSGAWNVTDAIKGHRYCSCLSRALPDLIRQKGVKTAVDLGAGLGHYSAAMDTMGIQVSCYDGNPATFDITGRLCSTLDLSQPDASGPVPADLAWSLEVGEHIPKEREQAFIDNVARLAAKTAVLSWAVPSQGGHGHVNEQTNEYIMEEFKKRGFVYDHETTNKIRMAIAPSHCRCPWFATTVMVFDRSTGSLPISDRV